VGEVGLLQCLRGEAAPYLRHQPGAYLLRAYARERRRSLRLTEELLAEANLGEEVARKLLADLAYQSQDLEEELAELAIALLSSEASARRPGVRQQIEICFSSLKRIFGLGETLATTLVGLVTRIAAKMTAYTYAFLINRLLGRPQGRIKDLWA
jgi:hypothetical protein